MLEGIGARQAGLISQEQLDALYDDAVRDTIAQLEEAGSPVVSDGEQRKPSFATYPLDGLEALAADGVTITFADGHTRTLPRLTAGPFRYGTYADSYLEHAKPFAHRPLKQAVIVFEREHITRALARHGGNRARTACSLGLTRQALVAKINRLGIATALPR